MNAMTDSLARTSALDALQAAFLAILPKIELHAQIAFRHLKCPDKKSDAIAEAVALAWHWYVRLAQRGKDAADFVVALTRFAARRVRAGRRLCGVENGKDVLSGRTQRHYAFTVATLPAFSTLEGTPLEEALQDNTVSPVPDQAAFRIDFPEWLGTLTDRDQRLLQDLAMGHRTEVVARKYGVTPGAVSHRRRDFHRAWQRFLGELCAAQEAAAAVDVNAASRWSESPERRHR
jgi:hypothetical protein